MNIGDLNIKADNILYDRDTISYLIHAKHDEKIEFNDVYLNISGYYTWKIFNKTITDATTKAEKQCNLNYVEYYILDKNVNTIDIFNKMIEYVNNKNKNKITLFYTKVLPGKNHRIPFYDGNIESIEVLEEKFMKPFFHQDKDRLWSFIKTTCLNPEFYSSRGQSSRASILLHGPKGSGKSTLVYRIARCLNRHIISLDLRSLDKASIYQILQRPHLGEGLDNDYKKTVFLFEEFDISVNELHLREQKEYALTMKYHDMMSKMCESNYKPEEEIKRSENEFCLRDLLEIFQGPIPFESMVMIANTNKYDEIKDLCPELFRAGRLTAVYFGYIDKDTLQEMSLYFFGKKLKGYIPSMLTIPTSQVIELAFESLTYSKAPFDYFNEKMIQLMNA